MNNQSIISILVKMKQMKNFKYVLMAVLAVFTSMTLTSCGNDDDPVEEKTEDVYEALFKYSLKVPDDMLTVADITIYYIGTDGVEHQESMTTNEWNKEFTAEAFDVSAGVYFTVKEKTSYEQKSSYQVGLTYSHSITSSKNGFVVKSTSSGIESSLTVSADKVSDYLKIANEEISYHVDKSGNISSTKLSWSNNTAF